MEYSILKNRQVIQNTSLFIALLFHVCGVVGILYTPYRNWFIEASPLTILLMFLLLVINQKTQKKYFAIFFIITFVTGLIAEIIGVNTSLLFGDYDYGSILGYKIYNVPVLIGINWFIIIYCAGCTTHLIELRLMKRTGLNTVIPKRMQTISFLLDAALLTTFFDWLMEPAAIKLGYWKWNTEQIPNFNYSSWFIISLLLLFFFRWLPFKKHNMFAVHLFIIESLFFLILRTFL